MERRIALAAPLLLLSMTTTAFAPYRRYHQASHFWFSRRLSLWAPLPIKVQPHSTSLHMQHLSASVSDSDDDSENRTNPPLVLTEERVAEMIEVSFVNACLQLSQGKVDVLKLFIAAIKSGYELGSSPQRLITLTDKFCVEINTAGRELLQEETRLRDNWIQLVFLTLENLQYASKPRQTNFDIDPVLNDAYSGIVPKLVDKVNEGEDISMDQVLNEYSDNFPSLDNPLDRAIVLQSLRVILMTLKVVEDEELCQSEGNRPKPQPPIPGAFQ